MYWIVFFICQLINSYNELIPHDADDVSGHPVVWSPGQSEYWYLNI